jgi:hypothetical protein
VTGFWKDVLSSIYHRRWYTFFTTKCPNNSGIHSELCPTETEHCFPEREVVTRVEFIARLHLIPKPQNRKFYLHTPNAPQYVVPSIWVHISLSLTWPMRICHIAYVQDWVSGNNQIICPYFWKLTLLGPHSFHLIPDQAQSFCMVFKSEDVRKVVVRMPGWVRQRDPLSSVYLNA